MSTRRIAFYLFFAFLVVLVIGIPIRSQYLETTSAGKPSILAGRNVNIGSGTKLPFGDPWLQRQNEPSIVASTRNPLHLFAGANDYRTIDVPDQFELPGIQGAANAHDAWLGVYESFDGGQSWITTLLPGFPQDLSAEGQLSPINTYQTACDPIVRAGANGLFYYCGIAFDRNRNKSAVFVARYQDNNNLEKVEVKIDQYGKRKYFGPIQYIDTKVVATGSAISSFIDMPNMAVDIPRKGALYGNIFVAYTVFSNTSQNNTQDRIMFQKSTDGGVTWSTPPVQLSTTGQLVQRPVIAVDPIDLTGKTIYVAFRRFAGGSASDGIVVVRSTDGGKTFSKLPDVVSSFYPFDQGTSNTSFRTNSYPTMAVGDLGTVYLAWSQRQGGPSGQARIMISAFKKGGLVWSTPKIVDQNYTGIGHQFMPSLTFASWKLMLAWYDQRGDKALEESAYIEDSLGAHRHTIDVRAAEGTPGVPPSFSPSIQVSRYLYVLDLDANGNPKTDGSGYQKVIQAEASHINYPLFQLGTVPFHGDYLEITASSKILPPAVAFGFWIYNINPLEPTSFHAAWTDNRDVRPPGGDTWGNWVNYSAPSSIQDSGWEGGGCLNGAANTGMRNQNVYTANINNGIVMGSPGNTKQLDLPLTGEGGRAFVVFVRNTTASEKTLKLVIMKIGGVNASFDQFINDNSIQVKVQPYSSISTTVYVDRSSRKLAPVTVNAFEGLKLVGYVVLNPDPTNLPLNDPDNPFQNLGHETHNPTVSDPKVWNYDLGSPDEPNPSAILNPRGQNESVVNNELANPRGQNTGVLNPRGQNESIVNYEVANPRGQNVGVENSALTDVTWNVTNDGNTTSAYTFNIRSNAADNFNGSNPPLIAQVLVYKLHKVPVDKDCQLFELRQDELIVNVTKPQVQNPRGQNNPPTSTALSSQDFSMSTQAANLGAQDVTFNLAPGEQADVIFRVWDENTADGSPVFNPNMVSSEAVAEAVNTDDVVQGYTTPSYDTPPNSTPWTTPSPQISTTPQSMSFSATVGGSTPSQTLYISNSGGGTLSYTLTVEANWLTVSPTFGTSTGVNYPVQHTVSVNTSGLAAGTYTGTITISDPMASNNPLRIPVTLTLGTGGVTPGLIAYYPFNGNANDESGNGNNGIVHGAALTQDRFGNPNGAYGFDGQSSYIAVPESPTLDITGPITIAAWIKPTVASGTYIVTKGDPTVGGYVYDLDIYPGQVRSLFHYQGGGSATRGATGATNIVSGTWQHVAVTWDGATVTVYYNGQPDGTGSFTTGPIIMSSMDLEIGRYYGGGPQPYFAGDIDDVRIYNRALSPSEIQALSISGGTDQDSAPLISTGVYQDYFPPLEYEAWVPHWFKIAVEEGQDIRVSTSNAVSPSGFTDLDMTIYDGAGGLLAGAYSSRSDETVYLSNVPSDMYYIVIWGPPDVSYTLTVAAGDLTGIGEITGRITNSLGNGVGNLLIEVNLANDVPDPRQVFVVTDSNGYYKIAYTPGNYKLYITFDEYFAVPSDPYVLPQPYPDVVSITAGATNSGHDAQLVDGGAISGRVTSASGEQVVQTLISARNPDGTSAVGFTRANNPDYLVGHIRIPAEGNVKLRFAGLGVPGGYIVEWYNDKYSLEAADLIPVQPRETTQGIDAQLQANFGGGSIQGRAKDSGGNGIQNVTVRAYDFAQGQLRYSTTDASGNYTISLLPAFAARVYFDAAQTSYASQWYNGKTSFPSADVVNVVYGSAVTGIDAVLGPLGSTTELVLPPNVKTENSDIGAMTADNGKYSWFIPKKPPRTVSSRAVRR